jgi:hypothetical protein
MRLPFILSLILIATACGKAGNEQTETPLTAQTIVDRSIDFHGLQAINNARITYDFRDMSYSYARDNGLFTYTRTQTDSAGRIIIDSLNNEGLKRFIDGELIELNADRDSAFTSSVNSVHYFTFLPYNLNDSAVIKEYLGTAEIKGKNYHEVKVTFEQEGGGDDFMDVYLYWFDTDDYSMDYLAYKFFVNGGGIRFREVLDSTRIQGIRFQNYINYKPASDTVDFMMINELFNGDELIEVSRIINENIEVTLR